MNPDLCLFIDQASFNRDSVERVVLMLPRNDAELDKWIGEAVEKTDLMAFMLLVVAAMSVERPVHAKHLARGARLLPGAEYLDSIIWRMHGDMPEYLLEGMRNTVMHRVCEAAGLFIIQLWCEEHRGGVIPDEVIPRARALARRLDEDYQVLAYLLALALRQNDTGLNTLLQHHFPGVTPDRWKVLEDQCEGLAERVLRVCTSPILDVLPEESLDAFPAVGAVRRAAPRVGRNNPCPCGSGKKYKHCCYARDQERLQHSSDVEGLTQRELHQNPEPHLTAARMEKTGPVEVARFDPLKIPRPLLGSYFLRLAGFNLFDRAVEAFEKLGYADDLEEAWGIVMFAAVRDGRKDAGERMLKLRARHGFGEEELELSQRLLLAQDDPAKCLELIEQTALKALQTEDAEDLLSVAYSVTFSKFSALGILLYRGVIPVVSIEQASVCLEQLLIARDRMSLPPDDPISDVIDARLSREKDEGEDAAALREAQEKFEAKRREVRALKESVDQLRKEIARRERAAAAAHAPASSSARTDEQVTKELRGKVDRLQDIIKERHEERDTLRRELRKTQSDLETLRSKSGLAAESRDTNANDEEDLLLPQEAATQQHVRIIEFPRNFQSRLNEFPRHIARNAMSMLGRLAGGDPAAFVGAVRLKAAPTVMRQRVGLDFRLLFRLLPDRVQVVDLIPRQDLERRIKSLAGQDAS